MECVQGHSVFIMDRGGEKRLSEITDLTKVEWGRSLDNASQANVTVMGRACRDQADVLSKIEPRRHELAIFRGDDRVWEGPIVQVARTFDTVTVSAKDVVEYLYGTALTKAWPSPENGGPELMGDRIEEIIEHELTVPYSMPTFESPSTPVSFQRWEQLDPPINLLPFMDVRAGAVLTRSDTEPFEMTVGEHLKNLARSGLDFTTVGRALLIWDSAVSIGETRMMTIADFDGKPVVYSSGQDLRIVQHVSGSVDDDEEVADLEYVGTSGAVDPYYGAWTNIHSREDEDSENPSQDALNTQARRLAFGLNPVPEDLVVPGSASFRLDDTLTIHDLVAGVEVPLLADVNGRTLNRMQRLKDLKVSEDSKGEKITGTLVSTEAS